jgi:nucleoside-diphosphate-sugar epimerase
MNSKKTVLVTGANGFIGWHCLPYLLEKGYEVHAVSITPIKNVSPNIHWHHVDLLDYNQTEELLSKVQPTHLLHCAWCVWGENWASPENFQWTQTSFSLLKSFVEHGGLRATIAGSCAEYDWDYGYCSESLTPISPRTIYGACKQSLHIMMNAFAKETELSLAWGRIFFLYGPYQNPVSLVPYVIQSLLKGKIAKCTHGNQIRDFLHVEDVASALVSLLDNHVTGPINIASGNPIKLKEIVYKVSDKLKQPNLIKLGERPSGIIDSPFVVADVSNLKEKLKWKPKYEIDAGLDQTIEWWKAQKFSK